MIQVEIRKVLRMSTRSKEQNPRAHRSTARGATSHLETKISTLEEKELLSQRDRRSIPRMLTQLSEQNVEFKKFHYDVVNQVDERDMTGEQILLNEHNDQVDDLTDRLNSLLTMYEPEDNIILNHAGQQPAQLERSPREKIEQRLHCIEENIEKVENMLQGL